MPNTDTREPPHSEEAETAVLGAILLDNELLPQAREAVRDPAAFYSHRHRLVYAHMLKLAEAGQPPDYPLLLASIRTAGELEQIGGASWLSSLSNNALRLANIEAYARAIKQTAHKRTAISTFHQAIDLLHQTDDPKSALDVTAEALDIIRRAEPTSRAAANLWDGVKDERPAPILTAAGKRGSLLTVGNVCLLSGEGGIAKSALALGLAVGIAQLHDQERGEICGLFDGKGGPALLATFEDHPAETRWRARCLIGQITNDPISQQSTLRRVHVLNLAGRPLFGPREEGGRYNERPGRLAGWWDLWSEARRIKPRLIVIDPALAAYVGESNAAAPVREFLTALATEAAELNTGVLLLAHSNKASRRPGNQNPKTALDLLDPGQVGGSTAWTDGVRGVLAMAWKPKDKDAGGGERVLTITKANYGPARLNCDLDAIRQDKKAQDKGAIVGFRSYPSGWDTIGGNSDDTEKNPYG